MNAYRLLLWSLSRAKSGSKNSNITSALTISRANDDKLRRFPTIKLSLFMTVCIMTTLTSKLQWRRLVKAGFWVIFFLFHSSFLFFFFVCLFRLPSLAYCCNWSLKLQISSLTKKITKDQLACRKCEIVAPVVTTATTVLPAGFSPVPAPRKRNALKVKKQLEQRSQLANVDGTGSRLTVADGRMVTNAQAASLRFSNNHNLSAARCAANDHHHDDGVNEPDVVDQGSPPLRGLSERLLEEAQSMPNCYQLVQQTDIEQSKRNLLACPAHQASDIRLQFEIACAALHGVRADLANSLASAEEAWIADGQSSTDDALPDGPFDSKAFGKCKRPPPPPPPPQPPTQIIRHRQAKSSEISISSTTASTVANPAVVLSAAHSIGYISESAKLQRYRFAHSSPSKRSSSLEFTPVEEDSRILLVPMVRPTSKPKRSAALEILNGFGQGSQVAEEHSNSCGSSSLYDASPPPNLSVRSVRHVVDKLIKQVESQIPRFRRSGGASRPAWAPSTQLDPDLVENRRSAEIWTVDHTLCCDNVDLMTSSVDESRRNVDACTQTSPLSLSCSSSFSWRSETDSIMANGLSGELSNNGFLADNEISGPNSEGSPMMTTTTAAAAAAAATTTTTTTTTALSSSSLSAFAFSYSSSSSSSSSCRSLSSVSDVADQKFATPSATAALLPLESDRSSNGATKRLSSQQAFEEALRLLLVAAADDRFDDPKLAEILSVIREPNTNFQNRPRPAATTGQQRCQVTFFEQPTARRSDHWTMSSMNNKSDENSVVSSLSPTFSSPETQVRFHQGSTSRLDNPSASHRVLRPDQSSSTSSSKTVPGYCSKQACIKFSPDEQQVVVEQDELVDGAVVGRFKSPQDDDDDDDGTRRKKKFSFSTVTGVISSGSNDDSSLDSDKWTPEIRLATEKLSKTFTSKKTLENGKKSAMDLGPPYKAGALIRSGTWLRREDSFAGDKRKSRVAGITALARSKSLTARSRCFQDVHLPSLDGLQIPVKIDALSVSQLTLTMKYALLHLTSILEKNVPYTKPTGFQFGVQRFFKRKKVPESTASTGVFGTALSVIVQRTGHPLPKCIYDAMKYIETNALDAVGIFRKSGVRSRIQKLKSLCDDPSAAPVDFDQYQAWDIADLIKLYFRELPDQLLTTNLSETFIYISLYVPESMKMDAIRKALLLLPDENREVLHTLLHFLHKISQVSAVNQMDAQNLAICLAPSLFYIRSMSTGHPNWRRKTITTGFPSEKELKENRAAQLCLGTMIRHYDQIFQISEDVLRSCCFDKNIENRLHFVVSDQGATFDLSSHYTVCCNSLIKEHNDKWRGWIVEGSWHGAEVTSKKITDSFPLKLWRCWTEVEAPPKEVLFRILFERKIWDPDMVSCRVVKKLTDRCDVFQYMQQETPPHLKRDFCTIRIWETDLPEFRGGCVLVAFSVNNEVTELIGDVRANCLAARYVIEPAGRGRSRLTYISRIDLRGRCKTWYNRNFGPLCARQIAQIRDSFLLQLAPGPETRLHTWNVYRQLLLLLLLFFFCFFHNFFNSLLNFLLSFTFLIFQHACGSVAQLYKQFFFIYFLQLKYSFLSNCTHNKRL
ncbi:Rho GTPase-activating protein 7 [Trichinella zimbabwensis]|uniref:Rho GTPase-activating protein 7 n=1 Tax=Trichinella zimbabwensis TaxID=268475 RepID=A0A0V1HSZ5_9BILA|nr:Rho GTPase-activating protein 7 [Trichinella zimbabwensis]